MPEKIKCGVIGAGWWATFAHVPALQKHPHAEVIALQKRNLEEAEKTAAHFGISHACTNAEELLAIDGLTAVVISSSPNLHYQQALAALQAGKHVLLEKPMTLTAAEAVRLVKIAKERDLQFLISCPWHFTAHGLEAQRAIRADEIGDIRMMSILMTNPVADLLRGTGNRPTFGKPLLYPHKSTYNDPVIAGGGQVYAQVSHVAAYLTFLTGAKATEVFARFHNDGEELDLYDAVNIRMDDGCIVNIASTGVTANSRRDFEVRIFGTKGIIFLDLWRGTMEIAYHNDDRRTVPPLSQEEIYPYEAPAMNLIDAILDPSRNQSPATLGVAAMEVIESAYRSARSGTDIAVSSLLEVEK